VKARGSIRGSWKRGSKLLVEVEQLAARHRAHVAVHAASAA
jgi:hypothetical protein